MVGLDDLPPCVICDSTIKESLFANMFVIQYLALIRPDNYTRKQLIPALQTQPADAHAAAGAQPGAGSSTRTEHLGSHPDTGHPSCWDRTSSGIYPATWKRFHPIPISPDPKGHLDTTAQPNFFSISCCFIPSATLATIPDLPNFFPHVISTALTSAASALSTTFVSDLPTLGIWYAISRSRLHPASPLCLVCASLPKNS